MKFKSDGGVLLLRRLRLLSLLSLSDCVLFFWVVLLFWCAWKISSDKQSGPPPRVDRFEQVRKIASVYAIFLGPPSPFVCIVGFTRCLRTRILHLYSGEVLGGTWRRIALGVMTHFALLIPHTINDHLCERFIIRTISAIDTEWMPSV